MAGRYLISGVQLGMLKGYIGLILDKNILSKPSEVQKECLKIIDMILEKQYVGDSENEIEMDVKMSIQ